jgi:hypothetical protein
VQICFVDRTHLFTMREDGANPALHERASATPHENVAAEHPEKFAAMREMCRAYYETGRWMLYRNKPERYRK